MVQQSIRKSKRVQGKIYQFSEYKKRKPFFINPIKITIDSPFFNTFYLVKNVVYKEKQILALKSEQDSQTIVLVEAEIEEGQLKHLSRISDEYVEDIKRLMEGKIS